MNAQTFLHFARGSDTPRAAADSIRESAASIREKVYRYIASCESGATADEIEQALGISGNTVRPRLLELRRSQRVDATDARRRTRSGRMAVVYAARC